MEKKQARLNVTITDGLFDYDKDEVIQVLCNNEETYILTSSGRLLLEEDDFEIIEQIVHIRYDKVVRGEMETLEMKEKLSTVVAFLASKPNIMNIKNLTSNIRL